MEKDPNSYVTHAELQEMAAQVLGNFVTKAELKAALDESMGKVIEVFKNPSPESKEMIRKAVNQLKDAIFAPPEDVDLVSDDAVCECGHTRIEHCGCGTTCIPPTNDIERARANRGESFMSLECNCRNFEMESPDATE